LLSLEVMRTAGIAVAGYVINTVPTDGAYPLALKTNRDMLRRFADVPEIGAMPTIGTAEATDFDLLARIAEENLDLDALVGAG
jgi:dethiobiotin synthetase